MQNVDYARYYAARGWHVFPIRPLAGAPGSDEYKQSKRPLTTHGVKDATTNAAQIQEWWSRWPDARIGVAGGPSGLLLVDVDSYKDGRDAELPDVAGVPWPLTATVRTPSGGWHYLYELPAGDWTDRRETHSSAICTKVNGYTILPTPGSGYEWARDTDPADLPEPLVKALLQPVQKVEVSEAELAGREATLVRIIGFLGLGEYRLKGEDSAGRVIAVLHDCPFDVHSAPYKATIGIASNGKPFARCVVDGCARKRFEDIPGAERPEPVAEEPAPEPASMAAELIVWSGADLAAADFPELEQLPMLGRPFIYTGLSTVIGAPAKGGKTTLVLHAVEEWLAEGRQVLYVTEESAYLWHVDKLPKYPGLAVATFGLVPSFGAPREAVLDRVTYGPEAIVVLDTLRGVMGWANENDNAEVQASLIPWIVAARDGGKTLVGVHHARKVKGGSVSQNLAGAHALAGAFDQLIALDETDIPGYRKADQIGRIGVAELYYRFEAGRLVAASNSQLASLLGQP